jgi:hypothetical protein
MKVNRQMAGAVREQREHRYAMTRDTMGCRYGGY